MKKVTSANCVPLGARRDKASIAWKESATLSTTRKADAVHLESRRKDGNSSTVMRQSTFEKVPGQSVPNLATSAARSTPGCQSAVHRARQRSGSYVSGSLNNSKLVTYSSPVGTTIKSENDMGAASLSPQYAPMEKTMEKMAKLLNQRHEFFSYLQLMRDKVRYEHPSCSRAYFHWLADSLTWAKFCR